MSKSRGRRTQQRAARRRAARIIEATNEKHRRTERQHQKQVRRGR